MLITVSGPSGVGKGSVCRELASRDANIRLSVSCTTRAMREGEREGESYFFVSEAEFDDIIARGGFLEYAGIYGKRYGTPAAYVDSMLDEGFDVILEIEMEGSAKVLGERPDTASVFVLPPDVAALRRRLEGRGTESAEQVEARVKNFPNEMAYARDYGYVLVNDSLDAAVEGLRSIIYAERMRTGRNGEMISSLARSFGEVSND